MENDFRTILATAPAVASLVAAHIYPAAYPQKSTAKAIRFRKVAGATGLTHRGSDGLSEALVQVDLRAATATEAYALRDAIVATLHAFAGTVGATKFHLVRLRSDRGIEIDTSTPTDWFTASIDFDVHWGTA